MMICVASQWVKSKGAKSSSCVVVVVLSGLDADGHQQAMVIHFDCGGLGHDLLCTILKSNCDLDKCNVSMFFASTHLPDLKRFLSESKMVYVLLHLVNHAKLFFTKNDLLFQTVALFRTRDQHHASNKQAGFPWEEFGVFEMVGWSALLSAKKIWHFFKKLQPQNIRSDC